MGRNGRPLRTLQLRAAAPESRLRTCRCATECGRTPNNPTADRSTAKPANEPSGVVRKRGYAIAFAAKSLTATKSSISMLGLMSAISRFIPSLSSGHAGVREGVLDGAAPSGNGDRSSWPAAFRLETETAAAQAESIRPAVLGCRSARLEQLVRSSRSRQARHGC